MKIMIRLRGVKTPIIYDADGYEEKDNHFLIRKTDLNWVRVYKYNLDIFEIIKS